MSTYLPILNQSKSIITVVVHRILCIEIEGKREGKDLESSLKLS